MAKLQERFFAHKEHKERAFLEECGIPAYAQGVYYNSTPLQTTPVPPSQAEAFEMEEAVQQTRIEESHRKLA
jgi:hypothetical protein